MLSQPPLPADLWLAWAPLSVDTDVTSRRPHKIPSKRFFPLESPLRVGHSLKMNPISPSELGIPKERVYVIPWAGRPLFLTAAACGCGAPGKPAPGPAAQLLQNSYDASLERTWTAVASGPCDAKLGAGQIERGQLGGHLSACIRLAYIISNGSGLTLISPRKGLSNAASR
jgi:hypothetical protein